MAVSCVVLAPVYRETQKFSLRVFQPTGGTPPCFHFSFVRENFVPWPYLGEREAGKCNLSGQPWAWLQLGKKEGAVFATDSVGEAI